MLKAYAFHIIFYFIFLRFVTLTPGDVFLTGTPPGVGVFRKPPVFLKVMVHDTDGRADVVLTGVTRCTLNTLQTLNVISPKVSF